MSAGMPDEVRARLLELRDEVVRQLSHGHHSTKQGLEWSTVSVENRAALVIVAGIDGDDLMAIASRPWYAFSQPERAAIQSALRSMRDQLLTCYALAARA